MAVPWEEVDVKEEDSCLIRRDTLLSNFFLVQQFLLDDP
jgi:hypothetical protein